MERTSWSLRLARALDLVGAQGLPQDGNGWPVRNAPSPLSVFVPFVRARGERRARRLIEDVSPAAFDGARTLRLRADGRWHDSGLVLAAGENVRYSAGGRMFLSRPLEVSIGARSCVWYRIGHGPIARLPGAEGVIQAAGDGPLRLQAALPGAFGAPDGAINTESPPPPTSGEVFVRLAAVDATAAAVVAPPTGWHYLWRIGAAGIFRTCEDGSALCCDTHGDVGILQHPVDRPLTGTLQLSWDWLVEALPSRLPEHVQPTHDYLSIAVEFDNGLDLTYMWSGGLPAGTIFQCPLPWWDQRETHWVLRTPADGLGRWIGESRSLLADYRRAVGGPVPQRIVAVWLIANSTFQNARGRCRYRRIVLDDGVQRIGIGP
ncbi:DUF3047 domain-containing protein [Fontimonas sp. SYSU GA230001]|uniref:DUF3047 domain-containing protein n=1 Tax=Fontimonas sp. SYSU GA230001 TaxID=3142450 RepID=UPI0032B5A288